MDGLAIANVEGLRKADGMTSCVHLELDVTDSDTAEELTLRSAGRDRDEFALGALKIGVLSLRHVSGQVDADAVRREGDRLMTMMNDALASCRTQMSEGMSSVLKDYFDPTSGRF